MADSDVRGLEAKEKFHFIQGRKMLNSFQLELARSVRSDWVHKEFQARQQKETLPQKKKS